MYNGNMINELINAVETSEKMKPTARQTARPVREESPMYWYPKYQEWMTLSQYEYRKQQDKQ